MSEYKEVVDNLKSQIEEALPKEFVVKVEYSSNMSPSITILAYDASKESVKVTYHNSDTVLHFMMFIPKTATGKWVWNKLGSTHGEFKYRKISGKTAEEASKKMVAWIKKTF